MRKTENAETDMSSKWFAVAKEITLVALTICTGLIAFVFNNLNDSVDKLQSQFSEATQQITVVSSEISSISKRMDRVSPEDVLVGLEVLKKSVLTREDLDRYAPWLQDKPQWVVWRADVSKRIAEIESMLREILRRLTKLENTNSGA